MDILHELEIIWILAMQSLGEWLKDPMLLISLLGQEDFYMLVMPIFYWSIDAALGFRLGAMLLLSNWTNSIFKLAFHSSRPYWFDPQVKGLAAESSFGIPSGHAQNAASLWGLLATAARKTWVKTALIVLIFLIGLSRLFLGVHYISDVLFGWLVGSLLLWAYLKAERPIAAYLQKQSLTRLLLIALATSIIIAVTVILSTAALGDWQTPQEWIQNAALSQPDAEIDPVNMDGAFTIAGTWFGLMAGVAWLYRRQGFYDASGTPSQRLLRYAIGVVGIFFLWFVLGRFFPRNADVLSFALRYLRYTLVGVWISALAPLLFQRLGLTVAPQKRIPPLSDPQNPL